MKNIDILQDSMVKMSMVWEILFENCKKRRFLCEKLLGTIGAKFLLKTLKRCLEPFSRYKQLWAKNLNLIYIRYLLSRTGVKIHFWNDCFWLLHCVLSNLVQMHLATEIEHSLIRKNVSIFNGEIDGQVYSIHKGWCIFG